ncbi:MAG: hypothetical protein JW384_01759 [Nitrosomonadaceae bacterium]|nr:hypothetical protein [Nitrosomonadaceae bacterium]
MERFDTLRIPLCENVSLLISDARVDKPESNLQYHPSLPRGWEGSLSSTVQPLISFDSEAENRGMQCLQLQELREYYWKLQAPNIDTLEVESSLDHSTRKQDWRPKYLAGSCHGTFKVVNYLGTAWITVRDRHSQAALHTIRFDVVTIKLDHESEYRAMVEAIAEECQQLLLEWNAPTTVHLAADPASRGRTLLEQFLFLRHVLGPDRLELFLELLRRRPHVTLAYERRWQPAAIASSHLFIRDPLRFGRDWQPADEGTPGIVAGYNAMEILEERKFDSLDTPPNRFVKFALHSFRRLCEDVMNAEFLDKVTGRKRVLRQEQGAAYLESVQMRDALDQFLDSPLFDDVGEMQRIPLESQTLQKQEGYRDILLAWLMLDAAARIDWPGRSDAYDGTNRDVATLYEFWLYFVLARAFKDRLGMEPLRDPLAKVDDALPFCCVADDGRMMISLKRGETSFCRFRWNKDGHQLRAHFFYNRNFSRSDVTRRGTYSKGFRPDYTLVVLPGDIKEEDWLKAEQQAEAEGRIAYVHFDAKYRVEQLTGVFGEAEQESGEDRLDEKATGTFKNADLYKMHTYNEAIRRTIGSYVLYPGSDPLNEAGRNRFELYHEIIPRIVAFALKPARNGSEPAGLGVLVDFVSDLLEHQLSRFTQSYRVSYWTEATVRESVGEYSGELVEFPLAGKPPKDAQILLGFVRGDSGASACKDTKTFFCHAVEWKKGAARNADGSGEPGEPTNLDFEPFRSDVFTAYYQNTAVDWVAKVDGVRIVTANDRAAETGRQLSEMNAAYYYRFALSEIQHSHRRDVSHLVQRRPGKPVACSLSNYVASSHAV